MRLYLVQHGEAVAEDVDPARPLSTTGAAEVRAMASFLAAHQFSVDTVMHSGKLRAEQTAMLLAEHLVAGGRAEAVSGLGPNDPVGPMAAQTDTWSQDRMIVGHLPFVAKLVSSLVSAQESQNIVAFEPGSVVCLERDPAGRWAVAWMLRPALLPPPFMSLRSSP